MSKVKRVLGGAPTPAPVVDNSAEIARQQEEERQAKILEGKGRIDQAFSQFTPDYFTGVQQSYKDYYYPQLQRQYDDTLEKLKFNLARSGNSLSSTGNDQTSRLFEAFEDEKRGVDDRASAEAARVRSGIEQQKSSLYGLNSSSADPALAASRASAAASTLQAPPTFSPLGDVFASFINTAANANAINQNAKAIERLNLPTPDFSYNKGSGRVVTG